MTMSAYSSPVRGLGAFASKSIVDPDGRRTATPEEIAAAVEDVNERVDMAFRRLADKKSGG
jgi:hypothetical protein